MGRAHTRLVATLALATLALATLGGCGKEDPPTRVAIDEAERAAAGVLAAWTFDGRHIGPVRAGAPMTLDELRAHVPAGHELAWFPYEQRADIIRQRDRRLVLRVTLGASGPTRVDCLSPACVDERNRIGVGSELAAVQRAWPDLACAFDTAALTARCRRGSAGAITLELPMTPGRPATLEGLAGANVGTVVWTPGP